MKKRSKGTRVTEDGREILSRTAWAIRSHECGYLAGFRCQRCSMFTDGTGEAHHKIKRGMGGGFRDDRMENLEWLCRPCHRREELSGSRTKMKDSKEQ